MSEDKIKETFDLFDRDGDGKISTKEVGTVLRALGLTPTEGEVANIIKDISEEAINFDFFKDIFVQNKREVDSEKELTDAFSVFDKEGTGELNTNDLRNALTTMGESLPEEEVDNVLKQVDKDGKIKIEDIIKVLIGNSTKEK